MNKKITYDQAIEKLRYITNKNNVRSEDILYGKNFVMNYIDQQEGEYERLKRSYIILKNDYNSQEKLLELYKKFFNELDLGFERETYEDINGIISWEILKSRSEKVYFQGIELAELFMEIKRLENERFNC